MKKVPRIERKCKRCGKVFFVTKKDLENGRGIYCSRKCVYTPIIKVPCNHCGKNIEVYMMNNNKYSRKFCDECYHNWYRNKRILKNCLQCEKEFYTYQINIERGYGIYCCKKCHNDSMKGKPATEKQLIGLHFGQQKGRFVSAKTRKKQSVGARKTLREYPEKVHRGKNHYNWKGGISENPYSPDFNEDLKKQILLRDKYTCQICSITQNEHIAIYHRRLIVHHIDYNKKNCKEENLITLCNACHVSTNYSRECWEPYFKERKKILYEMSNFKPTKIIFTYGVFDLFHRGHINLLRMARSLGDYLIVGIVADKPVKEKKGKDRPIMKQIERAYIINALKCVDAIVLQKGYDPSSEIKKLSKQGIHISILAKGDDWEYIPGQETIESLGGKLIKLPYSKGWSTSGMIKKIREGK